MNLPLAYLATRWITKQQSALWPQILGATIDGLLDGTYAYIKNKPGKSSLANYSLQYAYKAGVAELCAEMSRTVIQKKHDKKGLTSQCPEETPGKPRIQTDIWNHLGAGFIATKRHKHTMGEDIQFPILNDDDAQRLMAYPEARRQIMAKEVTDIIKRHMKKLVSPMSDEEINYILEHYFGINGVKYAHPETKKGHAIRQKFLRAVRKSHDLRTIILEWAAVSEGKEL
jgi:hypothetical protein